MRAEPGDLFYPQPALATRTLGVGVGADSSATCTPAPALPIATLGLGAALTLTATGRYVVVDPGMGGVLRVVEVIRVRGGAAVHENLPPSVGLKITRLGGKGSTETSSNDMVRAFRPTATDGG
jgi:hypothetical protein